MRFGLFLALALAASLPAQAEENANWSYEGEAGPAQWGSLDPAYAACAEGRKQSPIDLALVDQLPADLLTGTDDQAKALVIAWNKVDWQVVNNGHTIVAQPQGEAGHLTLGGRLFALKQFHFHSQSEHTRSGEPAPMEAHFVHAAEDGSGDLAVVGLMLKEGEAFTELEPILAAMPETAGGAAKAGRLDPAALLPESRAHVAYKGSLTTPPCSETVSWIVLDNARMLSAEQIARFTALYPANARPVQPLNGRRVLAGE